MATYATKKDVQEVVDKALDSHTLKLFKYLGEEFRKIDQRFDETDAKIDRYANAVDAYAKQTEKYMQCWLLAIKLIVWSAGYTKSPKKPALSFQ